MEGRFSPQVSYNLVYLKLEYICEQKYTWEIVIELQTNASRLLDLQLFDHHVAHWQRVAHLARERLNKLLSVLRR